MIAVKVRFFAYFRELFGASELTTELPDGAAVGDLLENLCDSPVRKREFYSERLLRSHIVVMINGRPIDPRRGLEELLHDGDVVAVFPFLGGG
ncbi:MAG: MoaD/ThiS family protein [Acidobacteriota bacterium]|nr:MoaD/ThiS family protein [Acidobacteriota bacterium]